MHMGLKNSAQVVVATWDSKRLSIIVKIVEILSLLTYVDQRSTRNFGTLYTIYTYQIQRELEKLVVSVLG